MPINIDTFWAKVDTVTSDCWLWTGRIAPNGYGHARIYGRTGSDLTHRIAYEETLGPIPEGMQLDHLCRVRHCCNPDHLQPVTAAENTRRGDAPTLLAERNRQRAATITRCPNGHAYGEPDTDGKRRCRTCRRERRRQRRLTTA